MTTSLRYLVVLASLLLAADTAGAQTLRERIAQRRAASDTSAGPHNLPPGLRVIRDVAYGSAGHQRFDVYSQQQASAAPVILMVHGGGWAYGDKNARGVVDNKVSHWVRAGFVVISVNYRMLPDAAPLEQARDVARAIAAAQAQAANWGGERSRFVLMGHSAGAHLVALLNAAPARAHELGAVALDGAAFDVGRIMRARHVPLFDNAFGSDPAEWEAVSPYQQLTREAPALLAVCSSQRRDSCTQAHRFEARAASLGARVQVLERELSHGDINQRLGEDGAYTDAVDAFLATLDPELARLLAQPGR